MVADRRRRHRFNEVELLAQTMMKAQEAAYLLGVTPRTVARYMTDGKLEFYTTLGGHRRPLTSSVRKYVQT